MIATRDIEPLELILKEDPAVVGPYSKSGSGCLHCLKKVDGSYLCSGCQFPMCDLGMYVVSCLTRECSSGILGMYVHIFFFSDCESNILHQDECRFFQDKDYQMKRRFSEFSSNSNSPLWITPLRMLLKKQTDPKMFDRINMLRDHTAPKVSILL